MIKSQSGLDSVSRSRSTMQLSDGGQSARIALRKTRIEQTRASKLKSENADDQLARRVKRAEIESMNNSKSKSQINASVKITGAVRDTGAEAVSEIKVGVTAREAARRAQEIQSQMKWQEREDLEKQASKEVIEVIDSSWEKVEKLSGPFKLAELLQTQKEACKKLLDIKDGLINDYLAELRVKDEEYVRELKRQSDEIGKLDIDKDKLMEKRNIQYKTYENSLLEEAEKIEQAFVQERSELIQANFQEINQLLQTRKSNEFQYMNDKANRVDNYLQQMERLRVLDSEEYNLLKIKLETDIQVLEQQLSQMRVTYQLNQEKLEYNYQVLKKREEENGSIIGSQKRKINRLAEQLNNLKVKSAKQDKSLHQEHTALIEDFDNLNHQYKQLFKKFRLFQQTDANRFKEIWEMNDEEAREVMKKILLADKIIHTQQLGMAWDMPKEDLFKQVNPLDFHGSSVSINNNERTQEEVKIDVESSLTLKYLQSKSTPENDKSRRCLDLLITEARFLIDDKLLKAIAEYPQEQQVNLKMDFILKALCIDSVEEIDNLLSCFINSENDSIIASYEVMAAIRKYSVGKKQRLTERAKSTGEARLSDLESGITSKQKQIREYWTKMETVLDEKSFRTWDAISKSMEAYNKILNDRWKKSHKIEILEKQNDELKQLLRQYMSSKINQELQVPPTDILKAQAGMLR